jgi:hypothetical protein
MSSDHRTPKQEEIDSNLSYFLEVLPSIPTAQQGKFALMRHREITGYYDTASDALKAAQTAFSDGIYSIQQVTATPTNLGYYSHAVPLATAQ